MSFNQNIQREVEMETSKQSDIDEEIPYEEMHPFLQELIDEHHIYTKELDVLEETIAMIESGKVDREVDDKLRQFFYYFDSQIVNHNKGGEKYLFAGIAQKMTENKNENINVIGALESDHVKSIQMAATAFNMFGLFSRIPDEKTRFIILDIALNQSKELLELLKVHIYREGTMIFPYAQKNFTNVELTQMQQSTKE
jgi:hemerythrin-like domain-containing protein